MADQEHDNHGGAGHDDGGQTSGGHGPIPSTAAIGGHPIHPMFIPFPLAFLMTTLLTDIAYWVTGDAFWAEVSFWLLVAGVVMGLLAATIGAIDFVTIKHVREMTAGWIHAGGNATVLVLAIINLIIRFGRREEAVLWGGLILSAIVAGILVVTGWYGGELAYHHKIGVSDK